MKTISYINKVEIIDSSLLDNSKFIPNVGVILSDDLIFDNVKIYGLAALEVADTIENKQTLHNKSLICYVPKRFSIGNKKNCAPFLNGNKKYSFRVTDYKGNQYLIGTSSRPFPLITFSNSVPAELSTKCCCKMSVNYLSTSIYPVL